MTLAQALGPVRYALDEEGKVADVLVPIATWKTLLAALKELLEATGGTEPQATLRAWLETHLTSKAERQALAAVEDELRREGLL